MIVSISEVTRILSQIEQGDPRASEELLPLVLSTALAHKANVALAEIRVKAIEIALATLLVVLLTSVTHLGK
jgi:hypothetical protein